MIKTFEVEVDVFCTDGARNRKIMPSNTKTTSSLAFLSIIKRKRAHKCLLNQSFGCYKNFFRFLLYINKNWLPNTHQQNLCGTLI